MAGFGGSVKLTGETEYKKALTGITQSLREVGSEMKLVSSEYGKNDKSTQALNAKSQVLNKQLDAQKTKLELLKGQYSELSETEDENSVAMSKLRVQMNQAQSDINKTTHEIDELGIRIKPIKNSLDRFEFELLLEIVQRNENGINFEYISPLMFRMANKKAQLLKIFESSEGELENNIFEDKNVCVIQLGNVNKEMKEIIPSLISNILYDNKTESKGENDVNSILNIVIDEAHNLLSSSKEETEIHGNGLKTFEKIIKEGRKFGVYLMIASQRPSDISTTITSQLQNYFIHKLVNPNDIEKIRKTVAYMNEASLNMVTVLGAGECIISGNALYIPQYAYIDELENEFKPNSANVKLIGNKGILE